MFVHTLVIFLYTLNSSFFYLMFYVNILPKFLCDWRGSSLGKVLLCKPEGLSSGPQHPFKGLVLEVYYIIIMLEEQNQKQANPSGIHQPVQPNGQAPDSVEDPVSKRWRDTNVYLTATSTLTCTQVHTLSGTCQQDNIALRLGPRKLVTNVHIFRYQVGIKIMRLKLKE